MISTGQVRITTDWMSVHTEEELFSRLRPRTKFVIDDGLHIHTQTNIDDPDSYEAYYAHDIILINGKLRTAFSHDILEYSKVI